MITRRPGAAGSKLQSSGSGMQSPPIPGLDRGQDPSAIRQGRSPNAAHLLDPASRIDLDDRYLSRDGYTIMKFAWLGIFTFGNVCAFISSFSPMIPLRLSRYAVTAYTSLSLSECGWM